MPFLQREIERGRCREAVMAVADEYGRPVSGAFVSIQQTSATFRVGARWVEGMEVASCVTRAAQWGSHLLSASPAPPPLKAACAASGVSLVEVAPPVVVNGAPLAVRARAGKEWGVSLATPPSVSAECGVRDAELKSAMRERWHMGQLRRWLQQTAEEMGDFFVYDVRAPLAGREFSPGAWALGGAERVQADYLAGLATVCLSVPQVTGFFYDSLTDRPGEEPPAGLLRSNRGARRAYKVLRKLFQHEWRTRAQGTTDAEGRFVWRGFRGTYQWTVIAPDGNLQHGQGEVATDAAPCVWSVRLAQGKSAV